MISLVAFVEYHLVLLLLYGTVSIYEHNKWILFVEIVAVGLLLVLRTEGYARILIGALRAKSERRKR